MMQLQVSKISQVKKNDKVGGTGSRLIKKKCKDWVLSGKRKTQTTLGHERVKQTALLSIRLGATFSEVNAPSASVGFNPTEKEGSLVFLFWTSDHEKIILLRHFCLFYLIKSNWVEN